MRFIFLILALSTHTLLISVSACQLAGKIIKIADGDTVTVLDSKRLQHKVRLAGIDTPEKKQPFGKKAKSHLSSLVGGKEVCVDWHKKDRYRRKVGKLLLKNRDINLEMVKSGLAWHYKNYQREQSKADRLLYSYSESKARSSVIGLWSEPNPIPPWNWRKGIRPIKLSKSAKHKEIVNQLLSTSPNSSLSCGSKRFCKQMNSCTEARFYLTQCQLSRLDRDQDGIPCESICR